MAEALKRDWRSAGLSPADTALCAWAEKLTRNPRETAAADVAALEAADFSPGAISDAAQVIGYFNYINRIADGLGVNLEPDMPPKP
jgi:uncharacterized peroxidase-related enzyme